ncbi:uncharacterized protein SETTUDRAFT_60998, partial [Exserohilum turcica Et28A]
LHKRNPTLALKLSQMALPIAPILHAETHQPPPNFPSTLLSLFLLTESQLDSLAAFYSQTPSPSPSSPCTMSSPTHPHSHSHSHSHLKHAYPNTMNWTHPFLDPSPSLPPECKLEPLERLKVKMRMFARFIGMRGAETPTWEYERQVQVLRAKIRWGIAVEE